MNDKSVTVLVVAWFCVALLLGAVMLVHVAVAMIREWRTGRRDIWNDRPGAGQALFGLFLLWGAVGIFMALALAAWEALA